MAALFAVDTAAADEPPSVDDIAWHNIESYCTFMRAGHAFVYDDADSWRWVFFTNFPAAADAEIFATGFMRIDGMLREFRFVSREGAVESGQTVVMRTSGPSEITATLRLGPGAAGYEATGYTGAIEVGRDGASSTVEIKGDCGV